MYASLSVRMRLSVVLIYVCAVACTQMRPVAIQQTLLLLNNFITNTTIFLADFADSCEQKISKVSAKINEIEITMAVIEAKLGSIPGLEYSSGDLPPASAPTPAPASSETIPNAADLNLPGVEPAAPTPPVETEEQPPPASSLPDGMVHAKDHPDYAKFFKLVKLGVPGPVIAGKMEAEGLNADAVDNPDMLVPAASSEEIEGLD